MTDKWLGHTKEFWKELHDNLDKKNYEALSTSSSIWALYADDVYRSAELLASHAVEAHYRSMLSTIKEFEENKDKGNYSRETTIQEDIERVDADQIRIAYFLLARAIELLLKATLLEIDSNSFFDRLKNKLKITNDGHDLISMIDRVGINLCQDDLDNLKLLSHYPFIGTYPIPVKLDYMIKKRELADNLKKRLSHHNYDDVAKLYDIVLAKYNELRTQNGKRMRINHLKLDKRKD